MKGFTQCRWNLFSCNLSFLSNNFGKQGLWKFLTSCRGITCYNRSLPCLVCFGGWVSCTTFILGNLQLVDVVSICHHSIINISKIQHPLRLIWCVFFHNCGSYWCWFVTISLSCLTSVTLSKDRQSLRH